MNAAAQCQRNLNWGQPPWLVCPELGRLQREGRGALPGLRTLLVAPPTGCTPWE